MPVISTFNPTTGEILDTLNVGSLAQAMPQVEGTGLLVFYGPADRATQYVDVQTLQLAARPLMIQDTELHVPADGTSTVGLDLLPGTIVRYQGEDTELDNTGFSFLSPTPGTFEFVFKPPFPYQEQLVLVVADEV